MVPAVDEPVEVERLDLTIRSSERPQTATLERVWIDDIVLGEVVMVSGPVCGG